MNNRLRRKELRMIKKNNQNENKQRIIPMYYDDELNRKVVTPICLPLINHPNKLILKIIDEETKNLLKQLFENGKCGDYIKDVINNRNHKDNSEYKLSDDNYELTSVMRFKDKYYEWESGKEINFIESLN